jgi:hypothetical protein
MTRSSLLFCAALAALVGCAGSSSNNDGNPVGDEPELKTGEASLVIPLIDEKKKLLSRFNPQLKAKGLKELPDTVEVKTAADAQKVADLRSYFDDNMDKIGAKDQAMPAWGPDSFTNWSKTNKTPGLCYRGNPTKIADVIQNGLDTMFSDQLVVQGWRYKTTKHFADGAEEFEGDFPDMWKEWRGDGTALLFIASQSDGGDDLTPSIIPRCK